MKKLAAFYIGWDAAVFLLLYFNLLKEIWVLNYIRKTIKLYNDDKLAATETDKEI